MTFLSWRRCLMPSWFKEPIRLTGATSTCVPTRAKPECLP